MLNLLKRFFIGKEFIGDDEGRWLRINQHYLNGPAFGGLIGTAHGFGRFLQDQLRPESVLFNPETKRQFEMQQTDGAGRAIAMTLGWHIRASMGLSYFFKEGGGGGFHSEMRIYPKIGIATVVMANSTTFRSGDFLNRFDSAFINSSNPISA